MSLGHKTSVVEVADGHWHTITMLISDLMLLCSGYKLSIGKTLEIVSNKFSNILRTPGPMRGLF